MGEKIEFVAAADGDVFEEMLRFRREIANNRWQIDVPGSKSG
jgi:hypothetical protein